MKITGRHFGIALLLVVIFAAAGGVLAIHHGFSARDNPTVLETFVAKTARALAVPSRAKAMNNPIPLTAESIAEAKSHWADHCAFCHANNGSGNTEVGRNLYPKAPDLRAEATQKLTDGELYYTIKNGIRLTGMPAWGEITDADQDSWKLVQFIRHLPQLTPEEESEMERLNPKGPDERQEEQEEEQFLNQSAPEQMTAPSHSNTESKVQPRKR